MALKTVIPFPIFAPNPTTITTTTTTSPTSTELRFAKWNNANADKFNQHRRTQQQIEDDLRRYRRFQSALNITNNHTPTTAPHSPPNTPYKSTGTPSSPSLSSIPAKKSKYKPNPNPNPHPAFRKVARRSRLPQREPERTEFLGETEVKIDRESGLSYVVPGAPFEFMYSYTEGPRVKPVGLREPAVSPFGPGTMGRPWTGRKPLPGTKKLLPEFDSFRPPQPGKKGVKSVQKPGPYLPGSGPRYVMSREEVLGEELTPEEVKELVEGCKKSNRQLNMGRDGLTHNMLDNIHAHWKRRRVCKIRCKGVCTVDMDNVCQQLEEKTGGKIIYRRGGVLYLFRGRNYNYRTRPRFPLMLWKPISPIYPRLVKRVPEGLTLEEATDMRRRGRELSPICKLGKNGVYINLANNVREAFEVCDLVRINCQGLNPSDYRKIGAKLKDLVPCVLISFENEHILMWRGKDWKSSILLPEDSAKVYQMSESDRDAFLGADTSGLLISDNEQDAASSSSDSENWEDEMCNLNDGLTKDSDAVPLELNNGVPYQTNALESDFALNSDLSDWDVNNAADSSEGEYTTDVSHPDEGPTLQSDSASRALIVDDSRGTPMKSSGSSEGNTELQGMADNRPKGATVVASSCTEGVLSLLRQAVDGGSALILDGSSVDADVVYERSVAFSKVAPSGPVFVHRPRKVAVKKSKSEESVLVEADKAVVEHVGEQRSTRKTPKGRKSSRTPKAKDPKEDFLDVVPQGSLQIDELAKLLA